ncbi:MAG: hypothetical protein AAFN92_18940, partial [Bacteroidota bacterium]
MRLVFFALCLLLSAAHLNAQPGNPAQADTASLRGQFDAMLKASNRYQQFKVVRQDFLNAYIANVSDSIRGYTDKIGDLQQTIDAQAQKLTAQTETIAARDGEISGLNEEKDGISLLGLQLTKTTYNLIMWSVIIGLLAGLLFALARMRLAVASHREVRVHKEKLASEQTDNDGPHDQVVGGLGQL